MDDRLKEKIIAENRRFMYGIDPTLPEEESDQMKRLTQPPLVKAAGDRPLMALPRDHAGALEETELLAVISGRRSHRNYADRAMTLPQLSWMLWATQGIQEVRGHGYASFRPVPSGGARHPFETYLLVRDVETLAPGLYHYLPMEHALECLAPIEDYAGVVDRVMVGQKFACEAQVNFLWTVVPYRAEWRYGVKAHKIVLVDLGHIGQNLYLAAEAAGFGCCGIGYYDQAYCDELLGLDTGEEFTVYASSVGRKR